MIPFPARLVVCGRWFVMSRIWPYRLWCWEKMGVIVVGVIVVAVHPWWDRDSLMRVDFLELGRASGG